MLRRLNTDALIAILLLIACAELFRQTFYFRIPPFATLDSAVWPRLVLGSLVVLSLVYLIQSLRSSAPDRNAEKNTDAKPFSHRNAIICFILFALFAATLPYLGMLLGGISFVFLMQELMGPRNMRSRLTHLAVAVLSVGGMWAVFTFALRVILPEGILLPSF